MKDFFISYNRHDRAWAEWIAWILEDIGYSIIIQAWDFRAGGNFALDMQNAASEAERTIIVLSENFLKSEFTQPEWAAAFVQDPTGTQRKLIPVRVEDCKPMGLLAPIVYVDFVNFAEPQAQTALVKALSLIRAKPNQKPRFPGAASLTPERPPYPPSIDQLALQLQSIRGRQCPKLVAEYGKIRLPLTRQQVDVNDLYVDVYVLTRLTSDYRATPLDLWKTYDPDNDRLGLGKRGNRQNGESTVQQKKYRRAVIVGKPGSGKSTFTQRLVVGCGTGEIFINHVPVLVPLRKIGRENFQLEGYLQNEWEIDPVSLKQILEVGSLLLLLDGLDEVSEEFQAEIRQEIERFSYHYPNVCIILTCRTQTLEYNLGTFEFLEIADFNPEQVQAFVLKWFTANDAETAVTQTEQFMRVLELNPSIAELVTTPILLALSCLLWRDSGNLPARRGELYEQGIDLLLEDWDRSREFKRDCNSEIYRHLSSEQKKNLLSAIALNKFIKPENSAFFKQDEIEKLISEHLKTSPFESRVILKTIEEHHGLLICRAAGVYSFSHLTFQEYFVSREFIKLDSEELLNRILDKRWREVFYLTVSRLTKPSDFLLRTKQKLDGFLSSTPKLQQFLRWVSQMSSSMSATFKPASIRAFYFCFALTLIPIDLDRASEFNLTHNLEHNLNCDLAYALDLKFDLARAHASVCSHAYAFVLNRDLSYEKAFHFALALARGNSYVRVLNQDVNLKQKLQVVKNQLPDSSRKNRKEFEQWWNINGMDWMAQLQKITVVFGSIGQNCRLTIDERRLLEKYYDGNRVLIDCLSQETTISLEVRQEIEDALLLPLAEIEQRRDK